MAPRDPGQPASSAPRALGLSRRSLLLRIAAALLIALVLIVAGLALFPWGLLQGLVTRKLSADIGRPVTIAKINRIDAISLHPTIDIQGVTIPQAPWAGQGDLAKIAHARVRFAAMPLLIGKFRLQSVVVDGLDLHLVRDAAGRESWKKEADDDDDGDSPLRLQHLTITNSRIRYNDAKRRRSFVAQIAASPQSGLRIAGTGQIRGVPVRIAVLGSALTAPWPFRAEIAGDNIGMILAGQMDHPLNVSHFTAQVSAHGPDLALLDAIMEAGLPGTQAVRFKAQLRRDAPDWMISKLTGTMGRSDLAGHATIKKRKGRTRIDGSIQSRNFDFRDLSSDEGLRKAAQKRARVGDRLVPDTAIDLRRLSRTDSKLALDVDRLLWPGSSPFRKLTGVLSLERSLLTIDPITLGLTKGRLAGRIIVDQRQGEPILTIDLALQDARLLDFFPRTAIDGDLSGKIRLTGPGRTIRLAVGKSNGSVALVARNGQIPARTASLLGQDLGRGLMTGKQEQAILRCMIVRLEIAGGRGRANPVLVDTSRALTRVKGSVNLATEQLAFDLAGEPKRSSLLRLTGQIPIRGTIKHPEIVIPPETKSVGGIVKLLGRVIGEKKAAVATDADCTAEAVRAMRR